MSTGLMSTRSMSRGTSSHGLLWTKLLLGAGLSFACAGILGIEEAECSDQFNGCPGFNGSNGDGDVIGDGDPANADSGTDGGETPEAGSDIDPEALCDEYCTEIIDNCVEDTDVQYPSHGFCMNVCSHFEIGDPDDVTGNTLFCRLSRARNAAISEPEANCQVAGPSGGNVCGDSICDNVCDMVMDICFEEFSSRAACMTDCDGLDDLETYNSTIQSGLEVQCRQYHVNAAATDAIVHCPHAGGAGPCSN